jgi:hypothetical protein
VMTLGGSVPPAGSLTLGNVARAVRPPAGLVLPCDGVRAAGLRATVLGAAEAEPQAVTVAADPASASAAATAAMSLDPTRLLAGW